MRIQQLTLHNIASIEDAFIDFEAAPLADSEVFLITGKTGAGKSTLLDAICLALYADTPRLDTTQMQGTTLDAEKEVKINDPRQLMRRNTGEAFVMLTFTGSNGIHYKATWSVARSRKKPTGNLQPKNWQLTNLDTGRTLTKDKEIETEIKTAIGLDFNQFCRTTLLAQGEFTRFLNSKDDEKAEILEKITGVDIYSRIGAKVFELTARKKQEWEEAQRVVEGVHTLTEEETADRQRQLSALETLGQALKTATTQETAKRDWMRTANHLTAGRNTAQEELRQAQAAVESEAFRQQEARVKDWQATIEVRGWIAEAKKAAAERKRQQQTIDGLAAQFAGLLGGIVAAQRQAARIEAELKDTVIWIDSERERVPLYENAQTIVGQLQRMADGRKAVEQGNIERHREQRRLTELLLPAWKTAHEAAENARSALERQEAATRAQEVELTALHLPELRARRDKANELLAWTATAQERIGILAHERQRKEQMRQQLTVRQAALEEKRTAAREREAAVRAAETERNIRKEVLEQQSDTVHKFAATLRLKLRTGDTCPVCRQPIRTALPHEEELAALVAGLRKGYEKAEQAYQRQVNEQMRLDAEIRTEAQAIARDRQALEADTAETEALRRAAEACRRCGMERMDSSTLPYLAQRAAEAQVDKERTEALLREGAAKEVAVAELRRQLEHQRKETEAQAQKEQAAEKAVNDCRSRTTTLEALVRAKQEETDQAEHLAGTRIGTGGWSGNWQEAPQEFARRLTAAATEYAQRSANRQKLTLALQEATANCRSAAALVDAITQTLPFWKAIQPAAARMDLPLLETAHEIAGQVTVALTKMRSAATAYDTHRQQVADFLRDHPALSFERLSELDACTPQRIAEERASLEQGLQQVVAQRTLYESACRNWQAHQQQRPELGDEETLETVAQRLTDLEQRLNETGERKGALLQELKTDQLNKRKLGGLLLEADRKKDTYQQWARLDRLIGNATGSKFRKIAQSYVLDSLIHSANGYLKTLTDRYTLKVTPGTFVISLEDAYQGYVSRAASTLSGGESFLVALSLALGLSDIGERWQVDTLFIDEGFGTLSGEPLQKAVETLRSLHSKAGRHVGIISHVEELQERIPVQIQVSQEGNSSSSRIRIVPEPHRPS